MLWKLPEISIKPEPLIEGGPVWLTNTLLMAIISAIILCTIFVLAARKASIIPGPLQNLVEWVTQMLLNLCTEVAGEEKGRKFFPIVATIFLVALINNWWSVIPGIDTIGRATGPHTGVNAGNELVPFFRPASTDLNFTIGLALVTVVMTQVYGFRMLGLKGQLGRYLVTSEGPIGFAVGILEFFLELLRVLSLSFRLFGNVFAGDVLLLVMSFIGLGLASLPFYFLEIFVGFIQAFVFGFLTLLFFTLGTTGHDHADHEEEHAAEVAHVEHERAAQAFAVKA